MRAGSERPLPSADFETRVRRSLTPPRAEGQRRAQLLEGLVAVAAVMALVAVGVPWMLGPRAGIGGPGAAATESQTTEPTTAPTPTPVPLVHAQKWMLAFDYPASWTLTDRNILQATHGLGSASKIEGAPAVFGFVGNASAQESCLPGGVAGFAACSTTWALEDDTIAIRFEVAVDPRTDFWEASPPAYAWTGELANDGAAIPGAQEVAVDNLPARFVRSAGNTVPFRSETVPGATEVLWWGLPSQGTQFGWTIVAAIKGPNTAELEGQAQALVASLHFVPEPQVLPTDSAALEQAREAALSKFYADDKKYSNDEHVHELDCFSTTVGEARTATITQTVSTAPLTRPLPVTCTVESAVPSATQGWVVTLSQSWEAGPDYTAGKVSYEFVLGADGSSLSMRLLIDKATLSTQPLYPNIGPSKYPG
jgi:hypothetical protein